MQERDRNDPQMLLAAKKHFVRAAETLVDSSHPDPAGTVRTLHLMMNVEIEMSYNRGLSIDQRLSHLQEAKVYSQKALEYALKSSRTGDAPLVQLYQAIVFGREAEVLGNRLPRSEAHSRKEEAVQAITRALRELSKLKTPEVDKHYAWTQRWQVRFSQT